MTTCLGTSACPLVTNRVLSKPILWFPANPRCTYTGICSSPPQKQGPLAVHPRSSCNKLLSISHLAQRRHSRGGWCPKPARLFAKQVLDLIVTLIHNIGPSAFTRIKCRQSLNFVAGSLMSPFSGASASTTYPSSRTSFRRNPFSLSRRRRSCPRPSLPSPSACA